ncbi:MULTISPECIES: hypothetical protein [unclassified Paenibacillus]|uniref:hypothetical protein n=1 Tax=unclassified Paenibacillus TaxID=185978 RepID=UPI0030F93B9C
MNRGLQSLGILKNLWMLAVLAGVVILLSACGTATDPIPEKKAEESIATVEPEADAILVEVLIESDSDAALNLEVEVNARDHPQSVYFDSIQLPYREEFAVPKDTFIPLTSTRVQAEKDADATWISCTILYDGEVVATHKSRGDSAMSVCEKKFLLGPG